MRKKFTENYLSRPKFVILAYFQFETQSESPFSVGLNLSLDGGLNFVVLNVSSSLAASNEKFFSEHSEHLLGIFGDQDARELTI